MVPATPQKMFVCHQRNVDAHVFRASAEGFGKKSVVVLLFSLLAEENTQSVP